MAAPTRINRRLDPATQDYVLVKGQREIDESLNSQVLFFITLEYNSSPAFPGQGAKWREVADKIYEDIDVRIQQEAERCLQPLLEPGYISSVTATTTVIDELAGVVDIDLVYVDATGRGGALALRLS